MGLLMKNEKQRKRNQILILLHICILGLRESEIAEELGWERRTANNYLRDLKKQGQVYKDGRVWQVEE